MSTYDHTMARLRQLVETQYHCAPRQAQMAAHGFFNAMDRNNSGSVDYREFRYFLNSVGFREFSDRGLFKRLDGDGSQNLDFWEVMSLYYIIKSDKPFCSRCDEFLLDTYFVCKNCVGCPYYFCNPCCQAHNNEQRVFHCYAVYNQPPVPVMQRSQTSNSMVMYTPSRFQTSNSMVMYTPSRSASRSSSVRDSSSGSASRSSRVRESSSVRTAYNTFETALNLANLAVGVASCSIM